MFKKLPLTITLYVLILLINLFFVLACRCFSKPEMGSMPAESLSGGETLFKANCSGCHLNGQNLIKPNKPIIGSLKLKSKESFKAFIESPPAPMPSFRNITSKSNQFNALYDYVVSLMGK